MSKRRGAKTTYSYTISDDGVKTKIGNRAGKEVSRETVPLTMEEEYQVALRQDRKAFDEQVNTIETELNTAIDSTAIEDAAIGTANSNFDQAIGQRTRAQQLYGSAPIPGQSYNDSVAKQLNQDASFGTAVRAQHDYRQNARTTLANMQDMLQGNSMNMLSNSAKAETDVENYNKQVEAQNKSNMFKQVAGIGTGLAVGYMTGNPYMGMAAYQTTAGG